jgi:uncharacterized membrane protein YphA (DoxX/SURF4 family)
MNIGLWILQVLVALAFAAHGWLFLAPPPEIKVQMDANLPQWFQLFMGIAELAAAVGLILRGSRGSCRSWSRGPRSGS